MLTTANGPVILSEKTLRALLAIRKEKLLPTLYGQVLMSRGNYASISDLMSPTPPWLILMDDAPQQELPSRVAAANQSEAATLRLALAAGASLILIDGPIKESAKLSFMKCEGTVSILVQAYRQGHLSAVQPMIKALAALGHADVLPPPEALDALWKALDGLQ